MNVYQCWYRGVLGYACRLRGRRWMFVPELGQYDRHVYRGVPLRELVFNNPLEKRHEYARDALYRRTRLARILRTLFGFTARPATTAGLLLLSS